MGLFVAFLAEKWRAGLLFFQNRQFPDGVIQGIYYDA
jgi:hypothetical protein